MAQIYTVLVFDTDTKEWKHDWMEEEAKFPYGETFLNGEWTQLGQESHPELQAIEEEALSSLFGALQRINRGENEETFWRKTILAEIMRLYSIPELGLKRDLLTGIRVAAYVAEMGYGGWLKFKADNVAAREQAMQERLKNRKEGE